jgi:CubicO group peptidase (beta-lactamase class C family)
MRKLKKIMLLLTVIISNIVLLHLSTAFSQEKVETDPFDGFPEYIEKVMAQWKVPGMAIGVVKDNKIIYIKGYGYRDVRKQLPVTPQTLFGIGSCTKAFTSMSIGMLVDDGKFEWDTPVYEFLPDFRLYDEYATIHTTPRDLLLHRTGIRGHNKVKYVSLIDRAYLFKILRYLEPNREFRDYFQYCNIMYQVAGHIVDRISGSTYEQFVSDRIFEPLSMLNSTISIEEFQKLDNIAQPYMNFDFRNPWGKIYYNSDYYSIQKSYKNVIAPSGGIYSCVEDMVEWIKLHLNRGKVGDKQIISTRNLRYMHTPYMGIRYYPDDNEEPLAAYGMGWYIQPYRGYYLIQHGGQMDGYIAYVSFMPFKNIGVVVLTNSYYHHAETIITENIYDRLLGLERIERSEKSLKSFLNASKTLKKRTAEFWTSRPQSINVAHSFDKFAGKYENPGYGRIVVVYENSKLQVVFKGIFTVPLRHYNGNVFATESDLLDYNHLKFHFHINEKGEVNKLTIPLESSVDDIVFTRVKTN